MTHVTISSKYQVVIPRDIRRQVSLHTGQKLAIIVKEGVISLFLDRPLASFQGFLKGTKLSSIREKRDRL